jgi:uncharacterized protein (UPF0147 family)
MENLSKEEINRKLEIWERMSNDPQIMNVAKDLVFEVIGKLKQAKKSKINE